MASKQNLTINFAEGLDTKTDPKQVSVGKFLVLQNTIFDIGGLLQKRNGYLQITALPATASFSTTFNGNLTAVGNSILALNADAQAWVSRGSYRPMQVSTLPLIRNNVNQIQVDSVIAMNGSICTVYSELNSGTTVYKYAVADSITGQNIIAPTLIPAGSGVVTGSPRVFFVGQFFVIVFTNIISAATHLQYIAVSATNPTNVTTAADIASSYVASAGLSWDGAVTNSNLYLAYNTTSGGQSIRVTYLTAPTASVGGPPQTPTTFAGAKATLMSVSIDVGRSIVYASYYDSTASTAAVLAVDLNLNTIFTPLSTLTSTTVLSVTSVAQNGACASFYEVSNNYSYDSAVPTHFIQFVNVLQAGTLGASFVSARSVGLASKAFIVSGSIYYLAAYQSPFQPTYFLINGSLSTAASPNVVAKLAYENGGGYLALGLPSVTVVGTTAYVPYLNKDLVQALTTLSVSQQTTTGGVYAQTGINLGSFNFTTSGIDSVEIGANLNLSGGFGWMYDGYLPVEQNFFLWPDSVEAVASTTGGALTAQTYFYQAVYEWSDNQGNLFRSAPSIPVSVTTTGATSSVVVNVPYLRLTYKTANPLKIVLYRWSTANPVYHQVTSITAPVLNSTTSDSVAFTDTLVDSAIQGNNIIYTNGGVIEDVNPPASNIYTLFDTRAWLVDAEDQNLLWYSKQIIESTPVEWSDLFTFYVAPTTAAQGSTGPMSALAPMDDKLIIFKKNAIYYINGIGPDNTGANNGYSRPIFVNSTVGCANQQSIVFMPSGLMFQSDKGIWLLGRDLSTTYIGAPVQQFNNSTVTSAVNIPATNQVRFTLSTGQTLMYDYFFNQWGTFLGVPAVSSCIYQGFHTFINAFGQVYQESPGQYLDGANPVLMSFTTSWLNLASLQGFERFYCFNLLGDYLSPHLMNVQVSYNYANSVYHNSIITPDNFSPSVPSPFGDQPAPFGSMASLEDWRIHAKIQKCKAFQIRIDEVFDPTFGTVAGAGFTLSGLNVTLAIKKGVGPLRASKTVG